MKKFLLSMVAMLAIATSASAAIISVNLAEGSQNAPRPEQTVQANETAGMGTYATVNWNNVQEDATGAALNDNAGAATAAVINFTMSNTWGDGSADTNLPDGKIARGYFDDGEGLVPDDGIGVDIQVTDVPFAYYSVVLYLSSDYKTSFGTYTVNGTEVAGSPLPSTDPYGNGWTGWVEGETALVINGLSGTTLDIDCMARWADGAGDTRGTIAGFQIVEVPEPATMILLGLGGLGLIRRRKA